MPERPAVVDAAAEQAVIEEALEIAGQARALLDQPGAELDPDAFMVGRMVAEQPESWAALPD